MVGVSGLLLLINHKVLFLENQKAKGFLKMEMTQSDIDRVRIAVEQSQDFHMVMKLSNVNPAFSAAVTELIKLREKREKNSCNR